MVWVILTMPHRKAKHSQSENRTYLAMEQTVLSKERTILSFMQTGLAFIGVGVVLINVFALSSWSVLVGSVLIIIGFIERIHSCYIFCNYHKFYCLMTVIKTHYHTLNILSLA